MIEVDFRKVKDIGFGSLTKKIEDLNIGDIIRLNKDIGTDLNYFLYLGEFFLGYYLLFNIVRKEILIIPRSKLANQKIYNCPANLYVQDITDIESQNYQTELEKKYGDEIQESVVK